ncbi:hypothetical protein WJX79_000348 [Trebouxia sp. C0005]
MPAVEEHWTRGAGGGIGMSDHQNSFQPGVCMGNWVETRAASAGSAQPASLSFNANTTMRADYNPSGKFGVELLANARYEGVGKEYACTNKELLFKHGEKAQPAAGSFCSLNELAMGEPCIGARHVQQCMWTGRNKPDARVPLRAPHYQMLLTKKTQQWQDDNTYNPYLSTSQEAARKTLQQAAGLDWRRESCRPTVPIL